MVQFSRVKTFIQKKGFTFPSPKAQGQGVSKCIRSNYKDLLNTILNKLIQSSGKCNPKSKT